MLEAQGSDLEVVHRGGVEPHEFFDFCRNAQGQLLGNEGEVNLEHVAINNVILLVGCCRVKPAPVLTALGIEFETELFVKLANESVGGLLARLDFSTRLHPRVGVALAHEQHSARVIHDDGCGYSKNCGHGFTLQGASARYLPKSLAKNPVAGSFSWPWHRCDLGMPRMTWSTCCPQPDHVVLPHLRHFTAEHMIPPWFVCCWFVNEWALKRGT